MNRQSVLVIWKSNPKLFITWIAIGIVMILFIFPPPCFSPNNVSHGPGPTPKSSESHTSRVLTCDELQFEEIKSLDPHDQKVIEYVKCNHLVPPSQEDYALTPSDPSEMRIELSEIFQFKRNGFFIECGANDGQYLSNTLELELERNWTGLLIEAHPVLWKKCLGRHRKAWLANVCASPNNSVSEIEFLQSNTGLNDRVDWRNGIGKLKMKDDVDDTTGIHKHIYDFVPAGTVKCFPLPTILAALNVKHVDFMSLDVQGVELKILRTFPFNDDLRVDYIQAEHTLVPEGKEGLRSFMESKGYHVIFDKHSDFIFEYVGQQA